MQKQTNKKPLIDSDGASLAGKESKRKYIKITKQHSLLSKIMTQQFDTTCGGRLKQKTHFNHEAVWSLSKNHDPVTADKQLKENSLLVTEVTVKIYPRNL